MSYNIFLDDLRNPWEINKASLNLVDIHGSRINLEKYSQIEWNIWAKDYFYFVNTILEKGELPSVISFDHDLSQTHMSMFFNRQWADMGLKAYELNGIEKTGYDCLKWLIAHCEITGKPFPEIYIHTANYWGRQNMLGLLGSKI